MPVIQPNPGIAQVSGAQSRLNGTERANLREQIVSAREERLEAAEEARDTGTEGRVRPGETINALSGGVSESLSLANADPNSPRGSFLDIVV